MSKRVVSCFGAKGWRAPPGHVHAVNSNLPVHSLQTDRKKTEQKANKENVLRLQQSHIHDLSLSTRRAAASYSSSSAARAGSSLLDTANGCVSLYFHGLTSSCVHTAIAGYIYVSLHCMCVCVLVCVGEKLAKAQCPSGACCWGTPCLGHRGEAC